MKKHTPPFIQHSKDLLFEGVSPQLISKLKTLHKRDGRELILMFELTQRWPIVELCTKKFKNSYQHQGSKLWKHYPTQQNTKLEFTAFQPNTEHLLKKFLWSSKETIYLTKWYSKDIVACLYPSSTYQNRENFQPALSDIPDELLKSFHQVILS